MKEKTLIYSFVSRGTMILAEYTEFNGNFIEIASKCLQRLTANNDKYTYSFDGHTFNFLVENGYTYCIVAVESAGRQFPLGFLERIKEDFANKYTGGKAATAIAHSLNHEFGPKLKEHMQYCMEHPDEVSKLSKVEAQVSQVKEIMMENIERVIDREEKIEGLVDKIENLGFQAHDFRQGGDQLRRKFSWLNMIKVLVLMIIIVLVLIIVLIVCLYLFFILINV